jgi:hypothetical protein
MSFTNYIERLDKRKFIFFSILFFITFIVRSPTLFNDYYDADELSAIIQTHEYFEGGIPGKDFIESKLPLYHAIFKLAYKISYNYGWVVVHFFTILIIFATAIFIYLSAKRLKGFYAGAIASLLYTVLVSSFNRHFMAVNGEIVFNLPVAAGFYFFLMFIDNAGIKKIFYIIASVFFAVCAANVKQQGGILFVFIIFFALIYYPYFKIKFNLRFCLVCVTVAISLIALFFYDLYFIQMIAPEIQSVFSDLLNYSTILGFNPLFFLVKFIHRQGMLILWHLIIWIPAGIYFYRFFKTRFRLNNIAESSVAVMFILTYLMIFLGGARLYFHYFIAVYPFACIAASFALIGFDNKAIKFIHEKSLTLLLIPGIFFLAWNTKDIIIKYFYPQAFYQEGKILYWARAVLVGSYNDYLLPEGSYKDVVNYIKKITKPKDRIYVWGDGPYLYYFSERGMGIELNWPKMAIISITELYKKGDDKSIEAAQSGEKGMLEVLKKKNAILFVDTSGNGLSTFTYSVTPLFRKHLDENFTFAKEINRMKIYIRNDYKILTE